MPEKSRASASLAVCPVPVLGLVVHRILQDRRRPAPDFQSNFGRGWIGSRGQAGLIPQQSRHLVTALQDAVLSAARGGKALYRAVNYQLTNPRLLEAFAFHFGQ